MWWFDEYDDDFMINWWYVLNLCVLDVLNVIWIMCDDYYACGAVWDSNFEIWKCCNGENAYFFILFSGDERQPRWRSTCHCAREEDQLGQAHGCQQSDSLIVTSFIWVPLSNSQHLTDGWIGRVTAVMPARSWPSTLSWLFRMFDSVFRVVSDFLICLFFYMDWLAKCFELFWLS